MEYFKNKKVLLTGAAGGFGAEFTRQLLQKGAYLVLSDIDEERLASKQALSDSPGKVIDIIGADLSKTEVGKSYHKLL